MTSKHNILIAIGIVAILLLSSFWLPFQTSLSGKGKILVRTYSEIPTANTAKIELPFTFQMDDTLQVVQVELPPTTISEVLSSATLSTKTTALTYPRFEQFEIILDPWGIKELRWVKIKLQSIQDDHSVLYNFEHAAWLDFGIYGIDPKEHFMVTSYSYDKMLDMGVTPAVVSELKMHEGKIFLKKEFLHEELKKFQIKPDWHERSVIRNYTLMPNFQVVPGAARIRLVSPNLEGKEFKRIEAVFLPSKAKNWGEFVVYDLLWRRYSTYWIILFLALALFASRLYGRWLGRGIHWN